MRRGKIRLFFNFVKSILLKVLIVIAVGSAISWFGGWREITQYVNVLTTIGALIIVFGVISIFGDWKGRANFGYLYGRSAGKEETIKYASNEISDTVNKYLSTFYYIIIGLITVGIAIFIDKTF